MGPALRPPKLIAMMALVQGLALLERAVRWAACGQDIGALFGFTACDAAEDATAALGTACSAIALMIAVAILEAGDRSSRLLRLAACGAIPCLTAATGFAVAARVAFGRPGTSGSYTFPFPSGGALTGPALRSFGGRDGGPDSGAGCDFPPQPRLRLHRARHRCSDWDQAPVARDADAATGAQRRAVPHAAGAIRPQGRPHLVRPSIRAAADRRIRATAAGGCGAARAADPRSLRLGRRWHPLPLARGLTPSRRQAGDCCQQRRCTPVAGGVERCR